MKLKRGHGYIQQKGLKYERAMNKYIGNLQENNTTTKFITNIIYYITKKLQINLILKVSSLQMRRSNRNFNIPLPGKPRTFELLKIGSFKCPPPRVKMVFKCPALSSDFVCEMPLLKNNRRRFLSSVMKLVYI